MSTMQKTHSADGTEIAYESYGQGPAVVIVGGAYSNRASWRELAQALGESGFTGVTYDRRGRGDSGPLPVGPTSAYAVQHEIEDLTAVIDSVVRSGAREAFAHGVSSGGALVLQAAASDAPLRKVSVLEPPYRVDGAPPAPTDYIATLDRFTAAGDGAGTLHYFHTQVVGLPAEMLDGMRGTPMWDEFVALGPTVAYDGMALGGADQSLPVDLLAAIEVPVLAVSSTGTPMPWLADAAAAVANGVSEGEHVKLEGGFHEVPIEVLVPVLKEFFLGADVLAEHEG